jgi:hypothetical protein
MIQKTEKSPYQPPGKQLIKENPGRRVENVTVSRAETGRKTEI